ncbi:MAG: pyruvate kinase [Ruminococcaceae bacterium]|nr:pyruvate kinase [Oscillospiraceae bacterium]
MRKTKIVCTIGPASDSEEKLRALMKAGMNVARLNFSHGTHEEHKVRIDRIKKVREELGLPVAILLDTKGPEYRIRTFENDKITLKDGDTFTFTTDEIVGNQERVAVSYKNLHKDLEVGSKIYVNNGLVHFVVERIEGHDIICKVTAGGELSNRKSMSFPGKVLKQVYLSEADKADLLFGIEQDVDFVACSFVSCKQDLDDVRAFLDAHTTDDNISLIAKIENQHGVDNIDEICQACDGIMIGRGDMGVEIPFEELPKIQKQLITQCRLLGKRVITATEMLESMIYNPRPTRAEISDVANAVYDGTSAIMLSGETAAGKYPVLAVETMAKIAETTEKNINYRKRFFNTEFKIQNSVDAVSHATCSMAINLNARAIVVCSLSGRTARMVSRFRPPVDIIGICVDPKSVRKLSLSWGVTPVLGEAVPTTDVLFYSAYKTAKKVFDLKKGDQIVITGGQINGRSGNTNLLKVDTIE